MVTINQQYSILCCASLNNCNWINYCTQFQKPQSAQLSTVKMIISHRCKSLGENKAVWYSWQLKDGFINWKLVCSVRWIGAGRGDGEGGSICGSDQDQSKGISSQASEHVRGCVVGLTLGLNWISLTATFLKTTPWTNISIWIFQLTYICSPNIRTVISN